MSAKSSLERRMRSGMLWSAVSNVGLRFGNVLVSVVVARILAPHEFGLFMIGLAVVMILNSFADLGMNPYLIRSKDIDGEAPTIMTMGVALSAALGLLMVAFAPQISSLYGSPDAAPMIRALSISMALNGLHIVPSSIMDREYMQDKLFLASLGGMAVSTAVTVVAVHVDHNALSLAWGRIAGQVFGLALMYWFIRRRPIFTVRPRNVRKIVAFGIPLSGANILQLFLVNIGSIIVAREFGEASLGLYMLAYNLSSWPLNIVGQSVRNVALPGFSQHEGTVSASLFAPAAALTWAAALPLAVLLAILGGPLIEVMYGSRWIGADAALKGLALYGAFRVFFDLAVTFAVAQGATKAILVAQAWWIAVLIPSIWFAVHQFSLAGSGWGQVFAAGALVLPAYLLIIHQAGASVPALGRRCVAPTAVAVGAAVVARLIADVTPGPQFLAVIVGGLSYSLVYAGLLLRWARAQLNAIRVMRGRDGELPGPDAPAPVDTSAPELPPLSVVRRLRSAPSGDSSAAGDAT